MPLNKETETELFQILLLISNNSVKQSFVYTDKYKNSSISNNSIHKVKEF